MQPRLIATHVPRDPEGVVLVLHGGASRGERMMVSPTQLSVVRMVPVARRLGRAGRGRLATYRLLNSYRGWDHEHTPVSDVAWALRELRASYGELPTALVGHSLGGRAALLSGSLAPVRSVVALNPWVYPTDDPDLRGRRVLFVHGDRDRIAPLDRSATVARRVAGSTEVGFVTVPGGKHAMLRRGRVFEQAASDFVTATLLGGTAGPPVDRVLAGDSWVTA